MMQMLTTITTGYAYFHPNSGFLFLCTDLPAKTGSLLSYTIFLYLYGNFV